MLRPMVMGPISIFATLQNWRTRKKVSAVTLGKPHYIQMTNKSKTSYSSQSTRTWLGQRTHQTQFPILTSACSAVKKITVVTWRADLKVEKFFIDGFATSCPLTATPRMKNHKLLKIPTAKPWSTTMNMTSNWLIITRAISKNFWQLSGFSNVRDIENFDRSAPQNFCLIWFRRTLSQCIARTIRQSTKMKHFECHVSNLWKDAGFSLKLINCSFVTDIIASLCRLTGQKIWRSSLTRLIKR